MGSNLQDPGRAVLNVLMTRDPDEECLTVIQPGLPMYLSKQFFDAEEDAVYRCVSIRHKSTRLFTQITLALFTKLITKKQNPSNALST